MKLARATFLGLGVSLAVAAGAADFNGSTPLTCTGLAGYDCNPAKGCNKIKPQSKTAPEMQIDLANKTVKTPYYQRNALTIANTDLNVEQLELQGTAVKFAWSAIVNRHTGKVTLTVADRVGAYVIFGQCKVAAGT
jgi:hypothetical protein